MKIGIDIGGSHVAVGLINQTGKIVCKSEENIANKLEEKDFAKILINTIIEQIQSVLEEGKKDITQVSLIGIAVPGMVSKTSIIKAENLHIKDLEIADEINKYFNVPIKLKNDAKCAALAEKEYGSLKKAKDAIFLTLGTGIGGAVFLNGELLVPSKYEGFEIGHMIIEKNGLKCNCGRNGCFEKYASMKVLKEKIAKQLGKETITGEELKEMLEQSMEDEQIENIVNEYIDNLSIGLGNLINIFEPEVISIGGSFAYYEKTLLNRLIRRLEKEELFNKKNMPKIVLAKLKNDAGIIGAVLN
ncbi:MAG: ROK family protein [Clostridia bacterium]